MTKPAKFIIEEALPGVLFATSDNLINERITVWGEEKLAVDHDGATFGYVIEGESRIRLPGSTHVIGKGAYFSARGGFDVEGGRGMLIAIAGYQCMNVVGGPIESKGRLRYIDGCTDSLLIPPTKLGDPCLNALYFPPGVDQTRHTHPSVRLGVVIRGSGWCDTDAGRTPLEPGFAFCIHAEQQHSFHTADRELVVLAYHPDSDFGPQDEDHPMVNRTMVDGVSASLIPGIRTEIA